MIALAYLCVAGVIQFAEQPLPGLEVSSIAFPAATASVNARSADIDEDGLADLVLPSGVWLQQAGLFPKSAFVPMPNSKRFDTIHAEKGRLYTFSSGRLACYTLFAQRWRNEWSVDLQVKRVSSGSIQPLFHDIDGDGHAEIIYPNDDKLSVNRVTASAQRITELLIYPPRRPQLEIRNNLWAALSSPSAVAIETRDFRAAFTGPTLITREALRVSGRRIEFLFVSYKIEPGSNSTFANVREDSWTSGPMPDVMTPYRSARNGETAFAGARVARTGRARLSEPLTEVFLAKRDNAPGQTLRTKAPPAYLALADFDGDGDEDLLTQSNTLMSGPPREVLMRLASAHALRHSYFVHVQDAEGRFDASPRQMLAVDINLGASALKDSPRWQAYRRGALTSVSADFNGDGRADITASASSGKLGVWINHEGVFQKSPDVVLPIFENAGLTPADVDNDGRDDLVVLPAPGTGAPPIVWFSR